ncbi:FtsX-like permease family protein [Dactylosporangium aurantiacum]|uniref:FtsX-like permease family protein n=1 Tax=Dactylosporangium aurantiacum TaxID=35754 RepID=A0A9Q9IML6_9ACTN|nr:ABC transporter permease [Dactylosporangium aurantiacum]MDG6104693.1 ABC transporter permease [Dactylosporangium aurantiacum]UWZ55740.1 FtsX-like permease family protein [Dactylosporangium aurantiacum]
MSAVWRAARAAVRRRRLQTVVIGIVVLFSTATIVVALRLLDASSAPFERVFDEQAGAHVTAVYEPGTAGSAAPAGAVAVAGPFAQVVLAAPQDTGMLYLPGTLTVVGRADPAGPVDRVDVWDGRWATAPGEIVVADLPPAPGYHPPSQVGTVVQLRGAPPLTVVGLAYSVSRTADAWVAPAQLAQLGPTAEQVLYRLPGEPSEAAVDGFTAALPAGGLLATQSYQVIKEAVAAGPGAYVPFLVVFGILGLLVAVLVVANVVSGAVVSGYRHIGVLKAIGFTPAQVVAVYLTMVSVPAVAGSLLGAAAGEVTARPLLTNAFLGLGFSGAVGSGWGVQLTATLGVLAVVLLAALLPALRARRLPAAEAISAGSAPRSGRGLRVQRWLSGARLPRSVSLGLGLPFARPARTALTVAAVVLGVTTVTFASGLATTVARFSEIADRVETAPVAVRPLNPSFGQGQSGRSDEEVERLLRSLPGTRYVTAELALEIPVVGQTQAITVLFLRGDRDRVGLKEAIVAGRWMRAPGEVVVPSTLLHERGLAVGDRLTLEAGGGRRAEVTVVGETMSGGVGGAHLLTGWETLERLRPERPVGNHEVLYEVALTPGTAIPAYLASVRAADPGLNAWDNSGRNPFTVTMIALSGALSLMLGTVAALSVLNTVLLNVRERRRDLGMLKSIGMTPRQVVVMTVTSMAGLGLAGGLVGVPAGVLAHRFVVPLATSAARVDVPLALLHVWQPWTLLALAVTGAVIAVLGALVPARAAARLTIAEVLHTE